MTLIKVPGIFPDPRINRKFLHEFMTHGNLFGGGGGSGLTTGAVHDLVDRVSSIPLTSFSSLSELLFESSDRHLGVFSKLDNIMGHFDIEAVPGNEKSAGGGLFWGMIERLMNHIAEIDPSVFEKRFKLFKARKLHEFEKKIRAIEGCCHQIESNMASFRNLEKEIRYDLLDFEEQLDRARTGIEQSHHATLLVYHAGMAYLDPEMNPDSRQFPVEFTAPARENLMRLHNMLQSMRGEGSKVVLLVGENSLMRSHEFVMNRLTVINRMLSLVPAWHGVAVQCGELTRMIENRNLRKQEGALRKRLLENLRTMKSDVADHKQEKSEPENDRNHHDSPA